MVQVDVFWSYGLASGLTLAAKQHIKGGIDPWGNRYLTAIVLWIGLLFAPSGMYLLWNFPSWETMQVASGHHAIPAWLVAVFGMTNVSQALLGYIITFRLIEAGKDRAAMWQPIWSHAVMFFILFVGWDGTGFLRFTHTGTYEDFHAKILQPWYTFVGSDVALTLIGMGVILIPTYTWLVRSWLKKA